LNPVTKIPNAGPDIQVLADNLEKIAVVAKELDLNYFGMKMNFIEKQIFYHSCMLIKDLCVKALDSAQTSHPELDDADRFIAASVNSGEFSSMKSILHYGQNLQ
jgi:hypothetical protein